MMAVATYNSKRLAPPDNNVAKSTILSIEEASTKIKAIIAEDYRLGIPVKETRSKVAKIISETVLQFKDRPRMFNDARVGLLNLFNSAYYTYHENMKVVNKGIMSTLLVKGIINSKGEFTFNKQSYQLKVDGLLTGNQVKPSDLLGNEQFRGFRTEVFATQPMIRQYRARVREQYLQLATMNPMVDTQSLRLKAEINVRYEESIKEEAKRKQDGVKLVWINSHSNCSKRCEKYQGKLYSLDGTSGVKDGNRYQPIEVAKQGPDGDGNGCTSGYNCRHYTIPYETGSTAPTEFDAKVIEQQRELDRKQRYYETQIRTKKQQEAVARASGDKTLADSLNNRWKKQLSSYQQLSLRNGRPIELWRTQLFRQGNTLVPDDEVEVSE